MGCLLYSIVTGIGATAVMDMWAVMRRRLFGIAQPDYGLVGRWLIGITHGQFRHDSIATSRVVPHERLIGWLSHYLIGIAFAALLVACFGPTYIHEPTLAPALMIGIGTVAAPFLLMQPGMGAGIAASRSRNPWSARLHSLTTHAVFGLGLYAAGCVATLF
jgi:cytochrome c biogenesis protein CcdA